MRKQLIILLGLIAAVAGFSAYHSSSSTPGNLREARVAEVYSTVLEDIVKRHSTIQEFYLWGETDAGAVPTLQIRLKEGLAEQQAKGGLQHQRAKFDRAMRQIQAKPETLADFEASNSAIQPVALPLKVSRPYHWVRDQKELPKRELPIGFSGVGFDHAMDEAVVTLNTMMMRQDFRLKRTAEHEWNISDVSGGRFVMD